MRDDRGVLREISWRDACPWLVIFRTFGLAVRPSLLMLGLLGTLLTPLGWRGAELLFVDDAIRQDGEFARFVARQRSFAKSNLTTGEARAPLGKDAKNWLEAFRPARATVVHSSIPLAYGEIVEPFWWMATRPGMRVKQYAYLAAGAVWTLIVWGLLGGTMTRTALIELGREESASWPQAFRLALSRLRSLVFAPWMPIGAIALLALPCLLVGLVMRTDVGVLIGGVLWVFLALAGFLIALLVVGVAFGWPLMWGAVTGESGGDEFEALHRSFSYVYGRPLHYGFYILIAAALGLGGSLVVDAFARLTIESSGWAVSWGAGAARWTQIKGVVAGDDATGTLNAGAAVIGGVQFLVWQLAAGFRYSFFWCAAAAIYLLMRKQVDDTEFNEIDTDDETAGLNLLSLGGDQTSRSDDADDAGPSSAPNSDV